MSAQSGRHVWVANLIVNNRPETMKLRWRSFRAAAGWSSARRMLPAWLRLAKMLVGFVSPKNAAPLALMLRTIAAPRKRRRFHSRRAAMRLEA